MKTFLTFCVAMLCATPAFCTEPSVLWTDNITANASTTFSGGSGSSDNPYLISSVQDLAQLAVNVNSGGNYYKGQYFRQTADIDLDGKYWIPIGGVKQDINYSFKGHYNGDFHLISNMNIKSSLCHESGTYKGFVGLFGWIGYSSIKNLGVVNGYVLIDNKRNDDAALLLGYADQARVDRCFATGTIEATEEGGFSSGDSGMGGLIGQNYSNGDVSNCYFIGNIISKGTNTIGGLMPKQRDDVTNCYVAATFETLETGTKYAITQKNANCFYDKTLNAEITEGNGTGMSTSEMKTSEMAVALGEAFTQNSNINNGYPYLSGFYKTYTGSIWGDDYKEVDFATIEELQAALTGNTIVSFKNEIPADWANLTNVVVNTKAKKISLSNEGGSYTYEAEDITADSVEFLLYPTVFANNRGGWMSIAIPFNGKPNISPIMNGNKSEGKYWAKKITGATEDALLYANLESAEFEAHVPYIFAFPGDYYGEHAFADKYLSISAADATVESGKVWGSPLTSDYVMYTIYNGEYPNDAYILNPEGTRFVFTAEAGQAKPFTAFATVSKGESSAPKLRSLSILDADEAEMGYTSAEEFAANTTLRVYAENGDIVILANEAGKANVFNVNGQAAKASVAYTEGETRITGLGAGTYIVAGQKVALRK